MTERDYFAWHWRARPYGPEPWWTVLERYSHLRRHGCRLGDPEVVVIGEDEMDDEEYANWVAHMHAADDEPCGCCCCCCLQSTGRWPPGLPHWSLTEEECDPSANRCQMPDGSHVTHEMIDPNCRLEWPPPKPNRHPQAHGSSEPSAIRATRGLPQRERAARQVSRPGWSRWASRRGSR